MRSLNPLDAIEVGITHRQPDQPGQAAWHPAERVDLPTMIAMYTINAAYGNHQERATGSIEVGKLADLIVRTATCSRSRRGRSIPCG